MVLSETVAGQHDSGAVPVHEAGFGFEEYVRARSAALVRSAYLLTGDRQLAEDLAQTALAGQTLSLTVTPATQIAAAGEQCDPSGLPAGTGIGFTATRTGSTTYRLDQLNV